MKHEQFQKDRSQNSNTSVEDGNGNDADVPADRDDPLNDATFVVDQVRVPMMMQLLLSHNKQLEYYVGCKH